MTHLKFMPSGKIVLLGLLVAGTVSACAPRDPNTGEAISTANPKNAMMHKDIEVREVTPIFVTKFQPNQANFSDLEKGRLLGFIQAQKAKFGDTVHVELPAFNDPANVNETRFGAVGSFLQDQGFIVEPKLVRDGLTNSLRVFYSRYVATVEDDCNKGWRKPEGLNFENLPLPHMGCSTASALAQMVENPRDLIAPKDIGPYDGERAAGSMQKYRASTAGGASGGASAK